MLRVEFVAKGLLCLLVIPFSATSEATDSMQTKSLPDVTSLLVKVRDHQDELDRVRENYTYEETVTNSELDKHGSTQKKNSKTYEVTFYRHRPIRRLIQVDGTPLSAEKQAKEDAKARTLIQALQDGKAERDPDENRQMKIAVFLRAERFRNPRRQQLQGRDVVVFDFDPDPSFKPKDSYETFYKKMSGTMSVDGEDLQVARVDFILIEDFKIGGGIFFDMKKGAHFVGEQGRFFDQIWLPTYSHVRFDARSLVFGFAIDSETRFGGYHRFDVSTEEKDTPPSEAPQ